MYRAYVGVISRCIVSTGSRLALLLKPADRTLLHQLHVHHGKSASGVDEFGGSAEIRGDSINSGQRWPEKWIDVGGYLEGKTDIPENARTSIIRHSLMTMIPSESSICHTNLGTTICFVPWSGY